MEVCNESFAMSWYFEKCRLFEFQVVEQKFVVFEIPLRFSETYEREDEKNLHVL